MFFAKTYNPYELARFSLRDRLKMGVSRQVGGVGERADFDSSFIITTLVEITEDHASIIEGT